VWLGHSLRSIPTPASTRIFAAAGTLRAFHYRSRKNVIYRRNVMRHAPKNVVKISEKVKTSANFDKILDILKKS
jgi:hypothetical protein